MKKTILVGSSESYSGKSAFCIGLGMILKEKGLKVGYMKPVGNLVTDVDGKPVEEDSLRVRKCLSLDDSLELMTPVLLTDTLVEDVLSGVEKKLKDKIKDAFSELSKDKEVMLVEGTGDIGGGAMFGLSDPEVAKLLNAKILLISRYDSVYVIDRILNDLELIKNKKDILGVVLNDVHAHDVDMVKKSVIPFLKRKGVKVLGILPKDPLLKSITVRDVVEKMRGKVLVGEEKTDNLIRHFIVGAMSPESALRYFRRVRDNAVITGGDRSDILMIALETKTSCLILTGNLNPSLQVLAKAEEKKIPVVLVPHDTLSTVHIAEELMDKIRVTEDRKLKRIKELVKKNVDVKSLI